MRLERHKIGLPLARSTSVTLAGATFSQKMKFCSFFELWEEECLIQGCTTSF